MTGSIWEWEWDLDLDLVASIELAALLEGEKPRLRWEADINHIRRLKSRLKGTGFALWQPGLEVLGRGPTEAGDRFVHLRPVTPGGCHGELFYVGRHGDAELQRLAALERVTPGHPEIGALLGYPACCVAAYPMLAAAGSWVGALLGASPQAAAGWASCNDLATFLDIRARLFDWFPCRLDCPVAHALRLRWLASARARGLGEQIDAAMRVRAVPLLVSPAGLSPLDEGLPVVRMPTGLEGERLLRWRRGLS